MNPSKNLVRQTKNKGVSEMNCKICGTTKIGQMIYGDGKFDSIKGKLYCEECYWSPSRKADLKKNSVSLVEYINNPNIFKDWGVK